MFRIMVTLNKCVYIVAKHQVNVLKVEIVAVGFHTEGGGEIFQQEVPLPHTQVIFTLSMQLHK